MRRSILTAFVMLAAALASPPAGADTLTILHLGDSHSHLASGGGRDAQLQGTLGGIARAASVIGAAESSGENVVTLHSGDFFIGDLFFNRYFGVPELRILAALGVDALALGNHETDLGPGVLATTLDSGFDVRSIPLLSANLVFPDTGLPTLRQHIRPYTISHVGGIRVGIFGLTTPSANLLSRPDPLVIDDRIFEIAAAMVDSLRARGCDVVVALSHLGMYADIAVGTTVAGIDVIVGGHDHIATSAALTLPQPDGGTTLLVQAGPYYQAIGRLRLAVDDDGVRIVDYALVPLDATVPEEPQVLALVNGMIADIESAYGPWYTERIAHCATDLEEVVDRPTEPGFKDTPLGNYITDAYRAVTGVQIGIEPSGSIAEKLYAGPLVRADAFRAVGYGFNTDNGLGFRLVTLRLTGSSLARVLEFGLSQIETGDDYVLQVSGMRYKYDPSRLVGERLVYAVVGTQALDTSASYTVVSNEFALAVFETLGIPFSDPQVWPSYTEAQVLTATIMASDTVRAEVEGRIEAVLPDYAPPETAADPSIAIACVPNPAATSATIHLRLPATAAATVTLCDPLGRTVRTLHDGELPAGEHALRLDARALAAGIYLCRVVADGRQRSVVVRVR